MEDISGDQWAHFAAVSRNGPVVQDFSIQQHSPAHSQTAPLGPDDWVVVCVSVSVSVYFSALTSLCKNVRNCYIREREIASLMTQY